jgi:non-canonical purine NTP pyrophosphatase (RdgB/HAM1 family)
MRQILLVTGNENKLREWQRQMPDDVELTSIDIDLPEIQSDDSEEIVADKAKRAYEAAGMPVVVEDVSAELEHLNGLPGPFIKFFMKRLGNDALYQLATHEGEAATISCAVAYYDGENLITLRGDVKGTVVAPRGGDGFGFDITFVPDGYDKTYAEMTGSEKDAVSHRQKAIKMLVDRL